MDYIAGYTNDGRVGHVAATWAEARNATTGTWEDSDEEDSTIGAYVYRWNSNYNIHRSFFWFNLGPIPEGADILSVTITMGGSGFAVSRVCIQEGLQGFTMAILDYDSFTGDYFDQISWRVSGPGGSNLNVFTLNAAGRAFVLRRAGKWIRFCVREYTHDYLDNVPQEGVRYQNGIYYSEASDEDLRPEICVRYK